VIILSNYSSTNINDKLLANHNMAPIGIKTIIIIVFIVSSLIIILNNEYKIYGNRGSSAVDKSNCILICNVTDQNSPNVLTVRN
jgi:hypothetical protein